MPNNFNINRTLGKTMPGYASYKLSLQQKEIRFVFCTQKFCFQF